MQKVNIIDMSTPKRKNRKWFCLHLSLNFEHNKVIQYHINWIDENGRSHNLSNIDKNQLENEECL